MVYYKNTIEPYSVCGDDAAAKTGFALTRLQRPVFLPPPAVLRCVEHFSFCLRDFPFSGGSV